ncbi:hypothetical protein EV182_008111 [Spiromyces aspiralis]|uniref:Uncharacterized protein n=1 Tax=Spiromyces aspiralis TaxID=68401 RepID=A0ACC1HMH3_9FUNG|nr:hypothetical protein EV182_008111 [Spiromyces aspiralis]
MSERVCEVVDYRSGELSNLRKLIELQGRIDWHSLLGVELHLCSFTPLLGMRRYIREGPMNKSSMSRKRIYAFLTNDMFILTLQWREGGRWLYELYHTPMQTCDIIIRVPELAMVSFASSEGGKSTKSQTANSAGDQQFSGIQSFEVIHTRSKETITLRTPDAAKWVKDLIKVSEVHYQAFKAAVESGMITIDRDRDKKKKKRNTHMLLTEEERNKIRQDIKPSHLSRKC